ncbi:hypothetical protein [Candidatus Symbiopectobacterium sp. NZEC135]|uniref:hypothetical protein n=1 Tax=Candidatus Symbiopectobacterium sp. NZEC135 TaxID=2820471 RepID=UPI0022269974|nr:hypothetical protein [Candidatus Symbiopectobacterium sp. NZEC135]MCW2477725.1 hypothetical protein [Candidatus Symbiopectobacterium sp. NZEC135]
MGKIKVGQIWKEQDKRFDRQIEVVEYHNFGGRNVKIKNVKTGRHTWASEERFNGKYLGYILVKDIDEGVEQ